MKSFIKWPGGKEQELSYILTHLPPKIERYIEPFVGGGSVMLNIEAPVKVINDKSRELILLYKFIKEQNQEFLEKINSINKNWKLIDELILNNKEELLKIYDEYSSESLKMSGENLTDKYRWYIKKFVSTHEEELNGMMSNSFNKKIENFVQEIVKSWLSKMKRLCKIEEKSNKLSNDDILDNIESSFKTAYYNHFRYLYNHYEECGISQEFMIAIFYFIRENCYASMFRYNSDGYFNVPYGGVSYNKKDLSQKILRLSSEELILALENVEIYNDDFQLFCEKLDLKKGDFIFIDPPYDTEFSTYAKNKFDQEDQIRLFEFAKNTEANVMIIIKKTDFIENLYRQSKKFNFDQFSKKYLVSFRDRNTRSVTHLVITNY